MLKADVIKSMMAYFLGQSGGTLDKLKLMKLLYLSEREYLLKYHDTLTGERLVSMPFGPVLSDSLNLINGINDTKDGGYLGQYFTLSPDRREVSLRTDIDTAKSFQATLSEASAAILADMWARFGQMGSAELVQYTHQNCHEWQDPQGSSVPIKYEALFAKDYSEQEASAIADAIREQEQLSEIIR